MKNFTKIFLLVLLISICILTFLIVKKSTEKFKINNSYKSITTFTDKDEVYSDKDKFYPSYKISLSKKDIFIKLLKFGESFFKQHKINYSIIYGTMLGYSRNKKFIPYDHDLDCIIGAESIPKLIELGENKNIRNVMFNDEIKIYKPDFKSDNIYLVLNKSLLKNKGWGDRYNCKGDKVKRSQDRCGFNGLFGRFILKSTEYDVFALSIKFKNLLKGTVNELEYPEKVKDMTIISSNDIKRDKLEDIEISVFKNYEDLLKITYGQNFIKPSK